MPLQESLPRTSSIGGGHLHDSGVARRLLQVARAVPPLPPSRDASVSMIAAAVPAQPSAMHPSHMNAAVMLAPAGIAIAEPPPHSKEA